jgi:hypothetical protein
MSAVQIFILQLSSRINNAGYPNCSCPYQSPVKLEHIVSKPRIPGKVEEFHSSLPTG